MSKLATRLTNDLIEAESRLRGLQEKLADVKADIERAKEKVDYIRTVLAEAADDAELPVSAPAASTAPAATQEADGPYTQGKMSMIEITIDVLKKHGPRLKLEDIIAYAVRGGFTSQSSNMVGAFSSVLSKYKHRADARVRSGAARGMYELVGGESTERSAA